MTAHLYKMSNIIDAVDPMVMTLRAEVAEVLSDDARFRFEICVTEALANLVTHAPKSDAPVDILLTMSAGHTVIEIFDTAGAPPFDLRNHATDLADVDAMSEGGRGLGLIMECADRVHYGPSGPGNSLVLEFWNDTQSGVKPQPANGADK